MENPSSDTRFKISLRPLTRFNWEDATRLELNDYQEGFMPSVLHTIAQSKFENLTLYGIHTEEELVGFAAHGEFGGVCWINRILVDKAHQQKGIGRQALGALLDKLRKSPHCKEIRTSFVRQNAIAEYLFRSMGFHKISDGLDDEIVMVFRG